MSQHQLVDVFLCHSLAKACFADLNHRGLTTRQLQDAWIHQTIIKNHIGLMQQNPGLVGQKGGITWACTDEIDMALLGACIFKFCEHFMQSAHSARLTLGLIGGGAFGKIEFAPKIPAYATKRQRQYQ